MGDKPSDAWEEHISATVSRYSAEEEAGDPVALRLGAVYRRPLWTSRFAVWVAGTNTIPLWMDLSDLGEMPPGKSGSVVPWGALRRLQPWQ